MQVKIYIFLEDPLEKMANGSNVPKVHIHTHMKLHTRKRTKKRKSKGHDEKELRKAKSTIYT